MQHIEFDQQEIRDYLFHHLIPLGFAPGSLELDSISDLVFNYILDKFEGEEYFIDEE